MFNSSLFPGSLRRPKPIFELPLNPTRRHYLIRPHKRRLGVSRLNRAGLEGAKERVAGTDETCGSHRIEWPLRSQSASGAAGPEDVGPLRASSIALARPMPRPAPVSAD